MIALYVAQLLLTGAALAAAALAWPATFGRLRIGARVPLAVALTPVALAIETLALATLWPGAPAVAFLLVPAAVAGGLLLAARPGLARPARLSRRDMAMWSILALAVAVALVAGWRAASAPATAHDILIYLDEARAFAAHPAPASIPGFDAPLGQVVKTHPHQFVFQAYLAQALLAQGGGGYPNDLVARFAAQLPLILLMPALFGLARAVLPTWTAALAAAFMLLFHLDYVCTASSIDAFRLAPFLVMVALLLSCVGRGARPPPSRLMLIGALAGVSVAIHTLNIAFVAIAGLAVLIATGLGWIRWTTLARMGLACAPFLLAGVAAYLIAWREYGHPFGRGFYYYFYAGTPLAAVFERQEHWAKLTDPLSAFFTFSVVANVALMVVATVAAIVVLARSRWRGRRLAMLALLFLLVVWIPLIPGLGLQGAMLSNLRYGLSAAALGSVALACSAGLLIRWVHDAGHAAGKRFAAVAALLPAMAIASFLGWQRIWGWGWSEQSRTARAIGHLLGDPGGFRPALETAAGLGVIAAPVLAGGLVLLAWRLAPTRWRFRAFAAALAVVIGALPVAIAGWSSLSWAFTPPAEARAQLAAGDLAVARLAAGLPVGARWAVDDYTIAYHADRPPLFLYSGQGVPLLHAATEAQALAALRQADVRLVALKDPRSDWWPATPLFRALARNSRAIHAMGVWRVFVLDVPERQGVTPPPRPPDRHAPHRTAPAAESN